MAGHGQSLLNISARRERRAALSKRTRVGLGNERLVMRARASRGGQMKSCNERRAKSLIMNSWPWLRSRYFEPRLIYTVEKHENRVHILLIYTDRLYF